MRIADSKNDSFDVLVYRDAMLFLLRSFQRWELYFWSTSRVNQFSFDAVCRDGYVLKSRRTDAR